MNSKWIPLKNKPIHEVYIFFNQKHLNQIKEYISCRSYFNIFAPEDFAFLGDGGVRFLPVIGQS